MLAGDEIAPPWPHTGFQDVGAEQLWRCNWSGSLASNRISGCRLPSPAWNTLAQRRPYFFHLLNGQQDVGQALARDGRVHAHAVGLMRPLAGAFLRPLQKRRRWPVPLTEMAAPCAAQHGALMRPIPPPLRACRRLAQQDGLGVEVVAGLDEVLPAAVIGLVHHLQAGRG